MNVSPVSASISQAHTHAQQSPAARVPATAFNDGAHAKEPQRDEQANAKRLSDEETRIVNELAARDREVRAHEQAHAAVGGIHAGAPSYTFEQGPNGKKYAVSGEVPISTSPVSGDAEATIRKADQVKRAALAPAQPSAQDRAVAAQATQMKIEAQIELREQKAAELAEQLEQNGAELKGAPTSAQSQATSTSTDRASFSQSISEQMITPEFVAHHSTTDNSFQAVA